MARSLRHAWLFPATVAWSMATATGSTAGWPYAEGFARAFATLAQAAYCGPSDQLRSFSCGPCREVGFDLAPGTIQFISHDEFGQANATFIYVARIDGAVPENTGCVVAIRGTKYPINWVYNLQFWHTKVPFDENCPDCNVETGFFNIWDAVKGEVMQALSDAGCSPDDQFANSVYITGHSLGAAVSNLAMFTLAKAGYRIRQSLNFESPRVGDAAYAKAFYDQFSSQIPVFRVTHRMDPVPLLPPTWLGYTHVMTEVYYDGSGGYKICNGLEDPTCLGQYSLQTALQHISDHCLVPLVAVGDMCNCPPAEGQVLV